MFNHEVKKRFKMYKAGKSWVVTPLVFLGLATGLAVTSNFVAADTTVQIEVAKQSTTEMVTDKKGEETQRQ